jgi:RecB family exonuclease
MISPRRTRLVRATDLRAFQRAIFDCLPADGDCAVIVPSRAAADELQRTLARFAAASNNSAPTIEPHLVTREEFYDALRERLPGSPAAVSPFDREVLLRRAARTAHLSGVEPPFNLRAGLIREILAFYDDLRRHHRTVADFARLTIGTLEPVAGIDRGAARLLQQTRFLAATFEEFERNLDSHTSPERATRVEEVDEHGIRALALSSAAPLFRHVIVTIADRAADPHGLWTTDFDLLARLPGLETIDLVATDALLEAGFHQRLHERLLPGIEDTRLPAPAHPLPVLLVPDAEPDSAAYGAARPFVCRDREEELADFARLASSAAARGVDPDRMAIVFQRPLPYLYLARQVFADARLEYQALDSLPLAAEPFAAAVDLIFAAIAAGFTRGALVELLRSPHFTFAGEAGPLSAEDVHALDRRLVKEKYLGGIDRLRTLAPACVADAADSLTAAAGASTAPAQIDGLLAFIAAHERLPASGDAWYERHMRARAAVLSALEMLRRAHAHQDPEPLSIAELSGAVRRWIEAQTFSPRTGRAGVRLLDAHAAPYADVDELRLVGLVESDWPERAARNIFYPASLLAQLGWPADQDRLSASRTRFQDLLRLPRSRVSLSTFTLEEDAIVSPSPLLEDVDAVGLPIERPAFGDATAGRLGARPAAFLHETLMHDAEAAAIAGPAGEWVSLRLARTFEAPRFRGITGPRAPAVYAVSRLERYLECPFKYFAAHVLRLPEERDEEAWMTPQERGHFVHEVFEAFFDEWQRAGRGAITTENVGEALVLFDEVAERRLETLPEGDRALERTLLLGSAAAAGFGERAFAFEIEDEVAVIERLLEFELEGRFTFTGPDGPRAVALRSKSDRIDLLADGTLRIVDYKIGRAPERKRSLQLPIYGACAAQALKGRHGREWTVGRAGYIAFKEKSVVELANPARAIAEGEARLLETLDAIERGEFPVRPDEPFLCNWCPYPGVCRKDYVGDEFEP